MKKADKYILLVISVLLILSITGIYIFKTYFSKPGSIAIISIDGNPVYEVDLSKVNTPYEHMVQTANGYNNIYIEKGQIKVIDANCPDKLCIKTGALSHTGDIAVCLPHGLLIEITEGETGDIDSLSY